MLVCLESGGTYRKNAPIAQSHPAKRTRTSYTEEEIERGLVATALASGNTRLAAEILAGEGLPIPLDPAELD